MVTGRQVTFLKKYYLCKPQKRLSNYQVRYEKTTRKRERKRKIGPRVSKKAKAKKSRSGESEGGGW